MVVFPTYTFHFFLGMWAHTLTCLDYQDLIDRGWRRFVIMFSVVCLFAETNITILFVISLACLWRVQLELTDAFDTL